MIGVASFDHLYQWSGDLFKMPKNKAQKNIGTSSLKVKPKKRPGLIKQLSSPFMPSSKKNKNGGNNAEENPVKLISARSCDDLGLFSGYDDMFLPSPNRLHSDPIFMTDEKELETVLKFEKLPLKLQMPTSRESCLSPDSGYMSPATGQILSPQTPSKGILKKMRSVSPDNRAASPIMFLAPANGSNRPLSPVSRPLSPLARAVSPLGTEFENALGFLDDVINEENDRKVSKKSVSFGDLAEIRKYFSDSSDNDLCDESTLYKKQVTFGDVENEKQKKNSINESFHKSVSFEDIPSQKYDNDAILRKAVSCEELTSSVGMETTNVVEKSELESLESELQCKCEDVCQYEVEVKVVDIQPVYSATEVEGQGYSEEFSEICGETCTELDCFSIVICHHPGCTQNNENRPMLLCQECDNNIHLRAETSGHLVLDLPRRKSTHGMAARFTHSNSSPTLPHQPSYTQSSMDIEEVDRDDGTEEPTVAMETEQQRRKSSVADPGDTVEMVKKLKRKKVVKAKRRHTTGVRSHSASDIFYGSHVTSEDDEEDPGDNHQRQHRYSYHGSIDENTLTSRRGSVSGHNQALHRVGKGTINHETFTVKVLGRDKEEELEIVAAEKNISLREAIQPILERRGLQLEEVNIFVEASNTPLPLNCETFLLGGTTMTIRQKDGEPGLPGGTQSLSKATGSKFTGGKNSSNKSSKSGMSRRESMIGRAQSMLEAPVISKQRRSSLQLPFQGLFPSPRGEGPRPVDEGNGSLRSRRGINLSIDDSSFPMALSASISPQGTLRDNEGRKQKPASKLTTLFSPLNKDKEKQEQLSELLNTYSTNGLPPPPSLVQLGQTTPEDDAVYGIEEDWRIIVNNSQTLTKRQQDQQEAIWELLQTELYYIRSLRVISDLFLCVLLNLQNELILNEIETEKLFNNIGEIAMSNNEFWRIHLVKVLQESRSTAEPLNPSLMKEGFKMYYELFQPYIQYCSRQKYCTDYMKSQYADNELFKTFVVWAETQKQCNRLKLTDLLVKPMQRLTKYSLLLQAILGKTDDEHQRRDLLEMIASVDRFVHHVNATLRKQHEEERLQAIVDKIEPYDAVEAPNDECLKLIQPYNLNFNLIAPMPGCGVSQTRSLIMQSPLKMKEYQNRMDIECLLFTDLLLICKASKRMDKYKIVKPPMRVDRIIVHELKDKGCFLLIYVNEYHIPVSSFTFHADQNAIQIWVNHIKKAQDLYSAARLSAESNSFERMAYPQAEIISEEVIGYSPYLISEQPPLLQLTRCASEIPDGQSFEDAYINRSKSWNEMTMSSTESNSNVQVPNTAQALSGPCTSTSDPALEIKCASDYRNVHQSVQYSRSDPTVFSQFIGDDRLRVPNLSVSAGASESDVSLPEFVDESMKSKLYQRRQSRTEKRYYTADAIQELNKSQNRDNSIYKRLSWNFPNGDLPNDKQGVLKHKAMSSDSIRSFHSSSGVSSTGSLHLSPEGDICEEIEIEIGENEMDKDNNYDCDRADDDDNMDGLKDCLTPDSKQSKSKSTSDIVSLMQELNTHDMKDGISSVDLPITNDPNKKLSHAQILRMKKQLLLSSKNIEASEV